MRRWIALGSILALLTVCIAGCGQGGGNEPDEKNRTETNEMTQAKEDETTEQGKDAEAEAAGAQAKAETESDVEGEEEPENTENPAPVQGDGALGGQTPQTGAAGLLPLAVDGTQLVDDQGNPVQLRGISTHGLAWYPDYVNEECFRQLKEEWGIDVIRLAMYTGEYGGYCTGGDQEALKELIRNGVEYATENDLYVIIDWHILSDNNPNTYIEQSKAFFREMSQTYADYTNVLYEICNEPNGGTSWSDVKTYAEQIIDVIRENDEDGVILVGTPNWCQYVDQAAADPIQNCENVMYTLHFYAATHTEYLRNTMVKAIEAGLPIFVSEYGICDASGNGAIDQYQADEWVRVMNQYGVSYVAWNLSNKAETSALFKSSCNKLSGFTAEDLSDSGRWLYNMLTGESAEQAGASWTGGNGASSAGGSGALAGGNDAAGTSGNGTPNGQGDSEIGPQAARTLTDASGLEVSASVVNSWEQDGQSCFQYTLTIKNPSGTDCTGWTVELNFNGDITLDNGWNGSYQVDGSRLTISSLDYNGAIPSGGSIGDVGFIVRGEKGLGL